MLHRIWFSRQTRGYARSQSLARRYDRRFASPHLHAYATVCPRAHLKYVQVTQAARLPLLRGGGARRAWYACTQAGGRSEQPAAACGLTALLVPRRRSRAGTVGPTICCALTGEPKPGSLDAARGCRRPLGHSLACDSRLCFSFVGVHGLGSTAQRTLPPKASAGAPCLSRSAPPKPGADRPNNASSVGITVGFKAPLVAGLLSLKAIASLARPSTRHQGYPQILPAARPLKALLRRARATFGTICGPSLDPGLQASLDRRLRFDESR
jgi:hypothetical protein